MHTFDVIVIGAGGMGSAAMYHLAGRGLDVLAIEQFGVAHDRGSSHGETRIIRKAYFEHPDYVPLLQRTYQLWAELEEASGQRLIHRAGLILAGPADGAVVKGVKRAAGEHALGIESLTAQKARLRFPGLAFAESTEVLFEADAGFLRVEACIRTHVDRAVSCGATVLTDCRVEQWSADAHGVRVRTSQTTYAAKSLVICGGPWSAELLADLPLALEVRRKVVFWYPDHDRRYNVSTGCPVFGFETRDGFFYGFPAIDGRGVKAGEHTGGETVDSPERLSRTVSSSEGQRVRRFLGRHLPGVVPVVGEDSVCMYTMSPDEHFVIDRHPEFDQVVFAAGFSGHGFKFAPLVGSVLADLVMDGRSHEPIAAFSVMRRGLMS